MSEVFQHVPIHNIGNTDEAPIFILPFTVSAVGLQSEIGNHWIGEIHGDVWIGDGEGVIDAIGRNYHTVAGVVELQRPRPQNARVGDVKAVWSGFAFAWLVFHNTLAITVPALGPGLSDNQTALEA